MGRVLSGSYDEQYYEDTQKIGRVHVKVGLPQRYMFTAMALIRVELGRIAEATLGPNATRTREAVTRLLDLELAIMLDTYSDEFVARVQRSERLENVELNRALQETEHRYVNAVELARVMILGLDARAEVRLFNREAERVTGFGRDEVLGRSFGEALLQEDLVETRGREILRAACGEQAPQETMEIAVRTKSGKYRDIRWRFAYAPSDVGDEVTLFAIGQDVTDELALQKKTWQQEKLASVGTLAAGLAHEIRNPLNGAQLHVSFLERGLKKAGAEPDMIEAVHVVGDEIKRLAALVTEFLDFARPRPPQLKPIAVRALAERVVQLMLAKAAAANVNVSLDLPIRDAELNVDPAKVEQMLLNLMTNAMEALAPSGGEVTMRVRRQPRSVFFEVEDDGPGIPSANSPIFDPFFSTKPDGTGLGLSITYRIATDHRGTIVVESRPGRTVFRVTLPLEPE